MDGQHDKPNCYDKSFNISRMYDGRKAQKTFWVGCAGSFDELQKITKVYSFFVMGR